ncbi:hypothetical protein B0H10DRAFT_1943583 [Mycena sp. CBHHK59/15]|nr:hypothetical protein B0H10DRAFT_1943583 [Mycena sp. CBHHK59/15]
MEVNTSQDTVSDLSQPADTRAFKGILGSVAYPCPRVLDSRVAGFPLGLHKKYYKVADHVLTQTNITRTVKQIGSWVQTARLGRDPRLPVVHRGVKYRPYGSASGSRVSLASGHLDPSGDLAGDGAGSEREIHRIDGNVITFASAPIGQTSGNGHMATFPPHISDVEAPAGNATGGYVQLVSHDLGPARVTGLVNPALPKNSQTAC